MRRRKSCVSDFKLWLYLCATDHLMLRTTPSVKFPAVISTYQSTASQAKYEIRLMSYCVILKMPLIIISNKVLGISGEHVRLP